MTTVNSKPNDSRTRRQRLKDAVLSFLEDQRPIREVTARRRAHNAFWLGVDAGEAGLVKSPRLP